MALSLMLGACGPTAAPSASVTQGAASPGSSAEASGTPAPVESASPVGPTPGQTAAASPKPPTLAIQANIAARVTVAELNVREWPTTAAKKVGLLKKGDVVALLGYGGIKAGGYTWFQAARIKGLHGPLPPLPTYPLKGGTWSDLTGWIAVGTGVDTYVTPLAPRCPVFLDTATVAAMLPGEQLACLGSTPLVLEGTFGCAGCGGSFPGTFTPAWLATPLSGFFSADLSEGVGPLQLYFPPDVTRPPEGEMLRIRGHFDDDRSSTCVVKIPTSADFTAKPVALRRGDAAIWCRQHLVVDSYDDFGPDPSFPPG
jgi:hypothetical protein